MSAEILDRTDRELLIRELLHKIRSGLHVAEVSTKEAATLLVQRDRIQHEVRCASAGVSCAQDALADLTELLEGDA